MPDRARPTVSGSNIRSSRKAVSNATAPRTHDDEGGDRANRGGNSDLLAVQGQMGNRAVSRMVSSLQSEGPAGRLGAFSPNAGASIQRKMIQRASFSELMSFWKQQELGQAPAPAPQGNKAAGGLPPEPAAIPAEVAEMNPILSESGDEQVEMQQEGGGGAAGYNTMGDGGLGGAAGYNTGYHTLGEGGPGG
ncbi:MAG: hypothetical protein ABI939_02685, partial [Anaerolineaceae bacterium]